MRVGVRWDICSSLPYTQDILYVSLCVSPLCCPPQQRRALHACHAPQKESDQHGRQGAAGGTNAFTQGQLQRHGEPQPPPLQPDGQQCQQPQQVWDTRSTQRHDCHHGNWQNYCWGWKRAVKLKTWPFTTPLFIGLGMVIFSVFIMQLERKGNPWNWPEILHQTKGEKIGMCLPAL